MKFGLPQRPRVVLLVGNDPDENETSTAAIKAMPIPCSVFITSTGEQSLRFLNKQEEFRSARTPDLVILKWNLPEHGGYRILSAVKQSEELKSVPVAVIGCPQIPRDVASAYRLHANCFIGKGGSEEEFFQAIQELAYFWLCIVKPPT